MRSIEKNQRIAEKIETIRDKLAVLMSELSSVALGRIGYAKDDCLEHRTSVPLS